MTMAAFVSTGSPRLSRRSTPKVRILDENGEESDERTPSQQATMANCGRTAVLKETVPAPLQSDTLSNLQSAKRSEKSAVHTRVVTNTSDMEDILARLRLNDARKHSGIHQSTTSTDHDANRLDKLLTDLNDQHKTLKKQGINLKDNQGYQNQRNAEHSSSADEYTPASGSYDLGSSSEHAESDTQHYDAAEILRVKRELEAARSVISRQEQELAETRTLKHTMDQAMGPPSEVDFGNHNEISEQTIGHLQSAFNASARPFTSSHLDWQHQDDGRYNQSDAMFGAGPTKGRGGWNRQTPALTINTTGAPSNVSNTNPLISRLTINPYTGTYGIQPTSVEAPPGSGRTFSGSTMQGLGYDSRSSNEYSMLGNTGIRRGQLQYRTSSAFSDPLSPFGVLPSGLTTATTSPPLTPFGIPGQYSNPQRISATATSPVTSDFPANTMQGLGTPWPGTAPTVNAQTYVTPLEPMNYRRLLDKSVSCDWKYIVDKIVCNNDQQASIFLQQKLKVGTAEQKFEIVESIVNQAYPLMINRFGNFLVQRCFEHGTPDQVIAIANAIHGNVLSLSMDPFGCHVIQKAFDSVPESHKADMVRELLRRIPDTVIHRYACHVWQKLFELRWSGEPPQIMLKVNEALRGMWREVALGETGSLVVQNIFENCVEEEKRPAIEEVIANIDLIAHGQFGNWCIQHLCEHGSPPDKRRVIDHILNNAYSYSIDQFASKVVEKCLKIGGIEFLERYLGVITTAHPDRPRIPLIDIAGDQYGNYLIQWILMNTSHHHREQVGVHIRKHMVSLRGSKFGSRVAMLCCNPQSATRPGPGAMVNPYGAPGQARSPWPRYR